MTSDFTPDKRRAMTPARKRRIHTAWNGLCWYCQLPVPMFGPGVVYDHVYGLWIKGSDDDADIGPIHAFTCNKVKTANDITVIAKIKRLIVGPKVSKRTITGRGFQTDLTRRFDGTVVRRER